MEQDLALRTGAQHQSELCPHRQTSSGRQQCLLPTQKQIVCLGQCPLNPCHLITFGLTMISISMAFFSCSLLIADRAIHKLLVLNILNFDTDLNSSTCAFGTWAISTSLSLFSYCVSVPPCKGQMRGFKPCSWEAREILPSTRADALVCWPEKPRENTFLVFSNQLPGY